MIGGSMRKSSDLKQEENVIDLGNKIEKKKRNLKPLILVILLVKFTSI